MYPQLCVDFCYRANLSLAVLSVSAYENLYPLNNKDKKKNISEASVSVLMTQAPLVMHHTVEYTAMVIQPPSVVVKIQIIIIPSMELTPSCAWLTTLSSIQFTALGGGLSLRFPFSYHIQPR